jgi:hypothetical protein
MSCTLSKPTRTLRACSAVVNSVSVANESHPKVSSFVALGQSSRSTSGNVSLKTRINFLETASGERVIVVMILCVSTYKGCLDAAVDGFNLENSATCREYSNQPNHLLMQFRILHRSAINRNSSCEACFPANLRAYLGLPLRRSLSSRSVAVIRLDLGQVVILTRQLCAGLTKPGFRNKQIHYVNSSTKENQSC